MPAGDLRDRGGNRGREEGGLTLGGRGAEDRLEVLREPHVEHLVGLVEHDERDPIELQAAAAQVVDGPAWRGDDDIDAAAKPAQLLADRLAAVDRQDPDADLLAVAMERLGNLHREFAGRHEDEPCGPPLLDHSERQPLEHRQREGRGLAGAGRSLGQDVAAGLEDGDRLALDRRRLLVAERGERGQQGRADTEGRERSGSVRQFGAVVCALRVRGFGRT